MSMAHALNLLCTTLHGGGAIVFKQTHTSLRFLSIHKEELRVFMLSIPLFAAFSSVNFMLRHSSAPTTFIKQ